MATVAEAFDQAVQFHQAGDFRQAEQLYRQILEAEPQHVDALHFLGLLANQVGRSDLAIEYIGEAVRLQPNFGEAYNNLGEAFRKQGRLAEAVANYERALDLQPDNVFAHNNLGIALRCQGRIEEAADRFRQTVRIQPGYANGHSNLGNILREQGRLHEAVACYEEALRLRPDHGEAYNNLGLTLRDLGKLDDAAASYEQALRLRPDYADAHFNRAEVLHQQGWLAEAAAGYQQVLHLRPDFAEAHNCLGIVFQGQGRLAEAVDSYQQALRLKPDYAEAHGNLGDALRRLGRVEDAVASLQQALRLNPDYAGAYHNLALVSEGQGKREEAVASYEQALRLNPNSAETHNNLANVLKGQGKLEEALAQVHEALRLRPGYANAYNNLGNICGDQGRVDEAIASYQQAVQCKPDFAEAHNNLGLALKQKGLLPEALERFQEAVRLKPDFADAFNNLGRIFAELGRPDEAAANYEEALRLAPEHADVHGNLGLLCTALGKMTDAEKHFRESLRLKPNPTLRAVHATMLPTIYQSKDEVLTWRRRFADNVRQLQKEKFTLDLTTQTAPTPFMLVYQGFDDRDQARELTRLYVPPADPPRPASAARPGKKTKVGFISHYFRNHTVGRLMRGLIANLSRETFAVTALSVGSYRDEIARFIQQHADVSVEVPAHLPAARRLIAEQALDVLIYTDVGMDPVTYSLAFSRLAPVQCVAWGHGVTTGIKTLDYFLSGELLETEEGDEHYTERLVRLPNLGIYYYRPKLPAARKRRADFGLPEDRHLYACFQTLFKFHPDFDALLGGILRRDPRGIVVLIKGRFALWEELLRRRFSSTLPDVLDRILFLPPQPNEDFLNLMALADVLVDPLFNVGGNSSFEGFALGMPTVTLPTKHLGGRLTQALYAQMGIFDCVAASAEEYIDKAVRLGTDAAYRAEVRAKIQAANNVLYENPAGVRGLEQFLQKAVAARNSATDETRIKHG